MSILFRDTNPKGNLGEPMDALKVAQRRRETLIAPEESLQFLKGWLKKEDVSKEKKQENLRGEREFTEKRLHYPAAMGVVPIAIGLGAKVATRHPLGLIILGGLLLAQLITYFFTPVVYLSLEGGK